MTRYWSDIISIISYMPFVFVVILCIIWQLEINCILSDNSIGTKLCICVTETVILQVLMYFVIVVVYCLKSAVLVGYCELTDTNICKDTCNDSVTGR